RTFLPNINIHLHHRADSYVVSGDESRLQQALLNLALNAQEAMPRGGTLALGLSHLRIDPYDTVPQLGMERGVWLHLTVTDTGSGIAPEALPHVFEPFFSTKPLHEGAGLGLAQVHGIVHQHGGHVKIESEPQKGAVVSIYLPLQEDPAPLPAEPTTPPGVCSILVVEENADLRDALEDALSGLKHNLVLTASGKEALTLVKQGALRPDLIIGDLAMPEISGIALLQAVRVHSPRCRMIIISSYPMPADQTRLRAEGVIQWLPKPVSMSELAERVQKALEG
ncbi:MAG: ATP-binding protein, partial [Chloroflexota bacterium]